MPKVPPAFSRPPRASGSPVPLPNGRSPRPTGDEALLPPKPDLDSSLLSVP